MIVASRWLVGHAAVVMAKQISTLHASMTARTHTKHATKSLESSSERDHVPNPTFGHSLVCMATKYIAWQLDHTRSYDQHMMISPNAPPHVACCHFPPPPHSKAIPAHSPARVKRMLHNTNTISGKTAAPTHSKTHIMAQC
jgi:hypothetical protein